MTRSISKQSWEVSRRTVRDVVCKANMNIPETVFVNYLYLKPLAPLHLAGSRPDTPMRTRNSNSKLCITVSETDEEAKGEYDIIY